jgi:hypothetical protein
MSRRNQILTVVLAVQIALAVLVFWPLVFPASAETAPLFGAITTKDIVTLTVQDKDGKSVELTRQGEEWVVPKAGDYPADKSKVEAFLDKIAGLKTNPLVTRTSASHQRLQVADTDYVRRVDFKSADGNTHALFIGSAPSGGSTHVRAGGQDEVYLARDLSSFDASNDVTAWINPVYLTVTQDSVVSLTLQNANGTFEFEKPVSGTWTLKGLATGEELDADSPTSLLAPIASLRMTRPLGKEAKPEYGLEQPAAVVSLTTKDDSGSTKTVTLRIGAKDSTDNSYSVISSESSYYVRVANFSVEDLVTKTRDGFLKPKPTPTPAATPAPAALPTTPGVTSAPAVTPTLQVTPKPTP